MQRRDSPTWPQIKAQLSQLSTKKVYKVGGLSDASKRGLQSAAARVGGGHQNIDGQIRALFRTATVIPGLPRSEFRADAAGNIIKLSHYGRRTRYGWQKDHIIPTRRGGSDTPENWQALHHEYNRIFSDYVGAYKPNRYDRRPWSDTRGYGR